MNVATMTNGQLEKAHDKLMARESEITHAMIADGMGHIRPSDMRDDPDCHPLARESLANMGKLFLINAEVDRRYGRPGSFVSLLVYSQGKRYRRVKPEQ